MKGERMRAFLVLVLFLASTLTITLHVQPVKASGTIYIRADGSVDPPTAPIQRNGDIYTLTSNITSAADGIVIERNNMTLDGAGYTLQGTREWDYSGIYLSERSNVTIKNVKIKAFYYGILLRSYTYNNTVTNNTIANNDRGIFIESNWVGSYIVGNLVTNNTFGIEILDSMFLTFRNNTISDNDYNLMVVPAWSIVPADPYEYFHDMDNSNTVDGKPVYYWINEHDKQIPADAGYVALINCTRITVENLNLTHNSQGVLLVLTTNSTIRNVNASNNFLCGISLEFWSEGNSVIRNTVDHTNEDGWAGILLIMYSSHNKVINNTVTSGGVGINVGLSENEITGNTVLDNKWGIILSGGNVLRYNNMTNNTYNFGLESFIQDIDVSNTVNGKPIYYWINQHDKQVPPDAGYVAIISSTNITVKNLSLTNNCEGVLIVDSSHILVEGVNASTVSHGIRISTSYHNTISGCTILNSGIGISLSSSNNNTITNSTILGASFGLDIEESDNNLVSESTIVASYSGVWIFNSCNNTIYRSSISGSTYGIEIGSCDNNIIRENLITNNYIGISTHESRENTIICNTIMLNTYYGIRLEIGSTGNVIYHNNFISNTQQAFSHITENIWDDGYPSGGNYWSAYNGIDLYSGPYQNETGSDGIGDTSYVIDENNRDRYPLMSQNGWEDYPITIESNATITNRTVTVSMLSFTVSGPSGQPVYVNVTMPVGLNTTAIKVFIDDTELIPPPFPIITSNGTHYFIYFEFTLSTHNITIQYAPIADVTIINVTPSSFEAYPTWSVPMEINVTVKNVGNFSEAFNVTLYWNDTNIIDTKTATLNPQQTKTLTYTWNIPTIPKAWPYPVYTFKAHANLTGDNNPNDNQLINGTVKVNWPGDIVGDSLEAPPDGHVDLQDLIAFAQSWFAEAGDPNYDPRADFDMDGKVVLIMDLIILAQNWFHGPLD